MKALAAEQTANFARRLEPLGLVVKELTGDMQLTKKEIQETQMIVTTPEKYFLFPPFFRNSAKLSVLTWGADGT